MIMNKNWFKKEPRVPEVKSYSIIVPNENRDPLDAVYGTYVEVSESEYMNADERVKGTVKVVSEAIIPYDIIEELLFKHINKTVIDEHTRDGKLNSLTRAIKSYKANYQSLVDILDKQIESSSTDVRKHAEEYKSNLPTLAEVDDILLKIDLERDARKDEKTILERRANKLREKIKENLKLEDEVKRIEKEIRNL